MLNIIIPGVILVSAALGGLWCALRFFKFIKSDPSTYLLLFRGGQVIKEGAGQSFFYNPRVSSLVSVPLGAQDVDFIFNELTEDFQQVTVQGRYTVRVAEPRSLASMLNFAVDLKGEYLSEDPEAFEQKALNPVQVLVRRELAAMPLREAMGAAERIASEVKNELASSQLLTALGMEVIEVSILAVMPNKETTRALEAQAREVLLRQADEAIYQRRNASIEQERLIKENELDTEAAVETKKRKIMERRMEAQMLEQQRTQELSEARIAGQIVLENENTVLASLMAENEKKAADAKAHALEGMIKPLRELDVRTVQALTGGIAPAQIIAESFRELAANAEKIGQLNISPDLLNALMERSNV